MLDPTNFDFRSLYVMYGIIFGWLIGLLLLLFEELFDAIHSKSKEKNFTRQ